MRRWFAQVLVLPAHSCLAMLVYLSLVFLASAATMSEQDAYSQAMALRDSDPPAAVRLLIQAAALDPSSSTTRDALEREKLRAADWWVPRINISSDPCQALKAVNEVLSWVPSHSGGLALRKELFVLSAQRSDLATRALDAHAAGSRDACSVALPTVSAWACMVPSAQTLANCAMAERQLVAANEAPTRASAITEATQAAPPAPPEPAPQAKAETPADQADVMTNATVAPTSYAQAGPLHQLANRQTPRMTQRVGTSPFLQPRLHRERLLPYL